MRARRSAHVAFMILFDRDSSYVVHGCWFASEGGEMKLLDFNEIMEFIWFSDAFSKSARACFLETIWCDNLRVLYVFVTSDLEILTKRMVRARFRHARAAERACGLYSMI